ncbi:MAG: peptidoglycan-binding domain-containing protein [Spirochaetota bacterium]
MAWNTEEIQTVLKEIGYYAGRVTGELNEETKAAIRKLQEINLLDITGKWDDKTEAAAEKKRNRSSSGPGRSWLEDVEETDSNATSPKDEPELPEFLR